MSKLIVEMEMPKYSCADCDLSIDGFACKKARMDGGKCPICGELPDEHGDLIDRDELLKECYLDDEDAWSVFYESVIEPLAIQADAYVIAMADEMRTERNCADGERRCDE